MDSLNGKQDQIKMYTTSWCPDCWRAKQVMESMKMSFEEINISGDEDATALVERLNGGRQSVPTILFPDGEVMTEPSTSKLVAKINSMIS